MCLHLCLVGCLLLLEVLGSVSEETKELLSRVAELQNEKWALEERVGKGSIHGTIYTALKSRFSDVCVWTYKLKFYYARILFIHKKYQFWCNPSSN